MVTYIIACLLVAIVLISAVIVHMSLFSYRTSIGQIIEEEQKPVNKLHLHDVLFS
jgi:hypothetical protein